MANFPNSVTSFPTRNVGDKITAAFFNDPNAEITAIEDGYINGTAPLNSSNSTVVNLSVTGNSTVVGTLAVSSNLTVAGAATLSSNLSVSGAVSFGNAVTLSNSTTPTLSSGNVDNLAVSTGAFFLALNGPAGGSTITGISAGQTHGRLLMVVNVSANNVDLANNTGSAAANRFAISGGANLTLASGQGVMLYYSTNGGTFWRGAIR